MLVGWYYSWPQTPQMEVFTASMDIQEDQLIEGHFNLLSMSKDAEQLVNEC